MRRNAWPRDAAAVALTRAADRWRIWLVAAALLATSGRFGRRAAARALVAAGIASTVAHGVVKPVVRRARPRPARLSLARFTSTHSSSSVPSGHAAVAAGFALGAAQEQPWSAVALAPLAAAIGWARVRVREHRVSDVAAGAAIGAAAAVATRRVWPVAPHTAGGARPALRHRDARPSADGDGVTIVVNPSAGPALGRDPSVQLREALPAARIVMLDDDVELDTVLRDAATAQVLGVCGGDGTVNAAAATALARDVPLLVVPGGTLNHFARDVGLATVDDAIRAVEDGDVAEVDVGLVDGHVFLNTASFGAYSELVDARERLEHRIGKWPALVVALARVLWRAAPCRVELDGRERRIWMIFIGNCCYEPGGFAPSWRTRLDDGAFDVRIVGAEKPWSRARLVISLLTGRLGRCRAWEQRTVRSLRVRSCEGPLRLAADGETFDGGDTIVIEKAPRRLAVVTSPSTDAA